MTIDAGQFADLAQGESDVVNVSYNVIEADRAFTDSTGAEAVTNAGTFYVVNPATKDMTIVLRTASILSPADALADVGLSDAVILYVGANNSNWGAVASYFVDGVETVIDVNDFVISGYAGAVTVVQPDILYEDTTTGATLELSVSVPDFENGTLNYDFTVNNINFVDGVDTVNIDGVDVDVYPELVAATARLTVAGRNDAPVAADDNYSVVEDGSLTTVSGVSDIFLNDVDIDGESINLVTTNLAVSDSVNNGELTLNANGTFTYTPDADFNGVDSFTYQIIDGGSLTSTATVFITVTAANDDPVVLNDSFVVNEDETLTTVLGVNDVLLNDTDVDGDTLSVVLPDLVVEPTNGSLTLNANGTFTYTPNANFNGTDSFIYNVTDGNGGTAIAAAAITINAVNDAPTMNLDAADVIAIATPAQLFVIDGGVSEPLVFDQELFEAGDYTGASIAIDVSNGSIAFDTDATPTTNISVGGVGDTDIIENGQTIATITTSGNTATVDFVTNGGEFADQAQAEEIVSLIEYTTGVDSSVSFSFADGDGETFNSSVSVVATVE